MRRFGIFTASFPQANGEKVHLYGLRLRLGLTHRWTFHTVFFHQKSVLAMDFFGGTPEPLLFRFVT